MRWSIQTTQTTRNQTGAIMGHVTIYADQERVLGFINERLEAGDDNISLLIASRSIDAIVALGHVITVEDLTNAVRYLKLMLDEDDALPASDLGCIAYIRRTFTMPEGMQLLSA